MNKMLKIKITYFKHLIPPGRAMLNHCAQVCRSERIASAQEEAECVVVLNYRNVWDTTPSVT